MSEAVGAFTIGSVECRVLPDGIMAYEPESLYAGLSPEDTGPAVRPLLDERGLVAVPYHPLLVQTAAGPVLIDTGAGLALAEESGEPVGRLPHALGAAGVAAEDVALVLLSHAHPDHIGGLTTENSTGRRSRQLLRPAAEAGVSIPPLTASQPAIGELSRLALG